jgi:hypothetical protein
MSESQIGTVKVAGERDLGDEYGLGEIANLAVGAVRRSVTEHSAVDGYRPFHRPHHARAIVINGRAATRKAPSSSAAI